MKKIITLFFVFFIFSLPSYSEEKFLEKYIKENNLSATLVIEEMKTGKKYVYNDKRAATPYLPASTFKIANTLIALQEKAVKDEKETIKWDGKDKGLPEWNKDQSMETALPTSCVWFYQELARRIKNEKYLSYLKTMNYGNMKTGPKVDTFWLEGDLRITAYQQIETLKNIYNEKYPFEKRNYEILKRLMVVDKTGDYTVFAKTGTALRVVPQIGWYVGYIETKSGIYFFACNLDMDKPDRAKFRKEIVYAGLREVGIIK